MHSAFIKIAKRFVLYLFSFAVLLLLLIAVLTWIYSEEIKNKVVASVNSHLNSKADVGEIDFTILKTFPSASVQFSKVIVYEPITFSKGGRILEADNITFLFRISDLFGENISFRRIEVKNAAVNMQIDANGNTNYDILKKNDTCNNKDVGLTLNNLKFKIVSVLY
jgi:uncharacterized protein involved in outer membrane biogenesis